jgi:hypothetical protein
MSALRNLVAPPKRTLSLPKSVTNAGGLDAWNASHPELRHMLQLLGQMCTARTVPEVLDQVHALLLLARASISHASKRQQHFFFHRS